MVHIQDKHPGDNPSWKVQQVVGFEMFLLLAVSLGDQDTVKC